MEYWNDGVLGLIQVAGYTFRVTGSTIFFLLNPQLLTRNGFHTSIIPRNWQKTDCKKAIFS